MDINNYSSKLKQLNIKFDKLTQQELLIESLFNDDNNSIGEFKKQGIKNILLNMRKLNYLEDLESIKENLSKVYKYLHENEMNLFIDVNLSNNEDILYDDILSIITNIKIPIIVDFNRLIEDEDGLYFFDAVKNIDSCILASLDNNIEVAFNNCDGFYNINESLFEQLDFIDNDEIESKYNKIKEYIFLEENENIDIKEEIKEIDNESLDEIKDITKESLGDKHEEIDLVDDSYLEQENEENFLEENNSLLDDIKENEIESNEDFRNMSLEENNLNDLELSKEDIDSIKEENFVLEDDKEEIDSSYTYEAREEEIFEDENKTNKIDILPEENTIKKEIDGEQANDKIDFQEVKEVTKLDSIDINEDEVKVIESEKSIPLTKSVLSKSLMIICLVTINIIAILLFAGLFMYSSNLYVLIAGLSVLVLFDAIFIVSIIKKFSIRRIEEKVIDFETIEGANKDEILEQQELISFNFSNVNVRLDFKKLEYKDLCESLHKFVNNNNLLISLEKIKEIISAMASSRVIFVSSNDYVLFDNLFGLISIFFGVSPMGIQLDYYRDFSDLIYKSETFYNYLENAGNNELINVCCLKYENTNLNNFFKDRIKHILYKEKELSILNKNITLSKNIWYFISLEYCNLNQIDRELLNESVYLNINLKKGDLTKIEDNQLALTINYNNFLVNMASNQDYSFISEDLWNKLEKIIDYVNNYKTINLNNKIIYQIEEFVKTFIESSEEKNENLAFDLALSVKLVPLIIELKLTRDQILDIQTKLQDIFGYDDILNTINTLKNI